MTQVLWTSCIRDWKRQPSYIRIAARSQNIARQIGSSLGTGGAVGGTENSKSAFRHSKSVFQQSRALALAFALGKRTGQDPKRDCVSRANGRP